MTIAKDLSLNSLISTITTISIIAALSFALAFVVNSYISYRFFELPEVKIQKKVENNVKTSKQYTYINYLFEKVKLPETSKTKNTGNTTPVAKSEPVVIPDIKLVGTMISGKEKLAILKVDGGISLVKEKEKVRHLKVKKIDRYSVILTDGVRDYNVLMDITKGKTRKVAKHTPPRVETQPVVHKETTGSQESYEISKREVEKYTADLGKVLRYVRIVPVVKNGETKGYKFLYVSPRSILYKYGIRSGDFIVSVNGMKIRTAEEAFKVYNMLRNEKNITLEVERRGERKVISYHIK